MLRRLPWHSHTQPKRMFQQWCRPGPSKAAAFAVARDRRRPSPPLLQRGMLPASDTYPTRLSPMKLRTGNTEINASSSSYPAGRVNLENPWVLPPGKTRQQPLSIGIALGPDTEFWICDSCR